MKKTPSVLFIVDGSLDRPILHSQGIPLMVRLSKLGYQTTILSFESPLQNKENKLASFLFESGVQWTKVSFTTKDIADERLSMISKGLFNALDICKLRDIDIVHCRSYRPAVIGNALKTILGCGFMFDMRGFLIDEQVILGRWKPRGIKYRISRILERWCLVNADAIIVNSNQFKNRVQELPFIPNKHTKNIFNIPNCVDTLKFRINLIEREKIREQMKWSNRIVLVFSGEARVWEDFKLVIDFFVAIKKIEPSAFLAFFVYGDLQSLKSTINISSLSENDYCLKTVPSEDMPNMLRAADIAILFRKESPIIKNIPSPIKFGEYLASGLPVVVNPNVGDTNSIIHRYNVGVIINPEDLSEVSEGALKITKLIQKDPDLRDRCHRAALQELSLDFSVQEYQNAYGWIASNSHKKYSKSI